MSCGPEAYVDEVRVIRKIVQNDRVENFKP